MVFVIIAARRMCFNLSALKPSRYLSVKSSLKRPLKFRIRLLSSFFPSEAIDVAVCSKYSLEAMVIFLNTYGTDYYLQTHFQYRQKQIGAFGLNFQNPKTTETGRFIEIIFFVIFILV